MNSDGARGIPSAVALLLFGTRGRARGSWLGSEIGGDERPLLMPGPEGGDQGPWLKFVDGPTSGSVSCAGRPPDTEPSTRSFSGACRTTDAAPNADCPAAGDTLPRRRGAVVYSFKNEEGSVGVELLTCLRIFKGFVLSGNGEEGCKGPSCTESSSCVGEPSDMMLSVSREGLRCSRSGTGGTSC
jgi:hypothetical protein